MRILTAFTISMLLAGPAWALGTPALQSEAQRLKGLTLEELLSVDVTLATRRPEALGTSSAAVSVLRHDDIRRSGATTIADALTLADGLYVGRFNNGSWAIGARGFTGSSPNKLLVMIDGRSVYSELLTGVLWNTLDYTLEDIDRIEVIRGPGAALWGANAVNGVINIVTRHTRDTQGTFVQVGSGNEDPVLLDARHGGTVGRSTTWRAYGKFAARDPQQFSTGISAEDGRRRGQVGFRVDGGRPATHQWFLKGDAFHSRDRLIDRPAAEFSDVSVQGHLSKTVGASRIEAQAFYRYEYRRVPRQLTHRLHTVDVEAQQTFGRGRHQAMWGAGARLNRDRTWPSDVISFEPESRRYPIYSAFVQDEIALLPRRLSMTVGAKIEHEAFDGAHFQPSVRGRLTLGSGAVWGAVSRAVRRPTRFDEDIRLTGPNSLLLLRGSADFRAESLVAYEAGYRVQPSRMLSMDASVFVHRIDRLRSQDSPATIIPAVLGNTLNGRARGLELGIDIQPVTRWTTHVSYTWLGTSITADADSRDLTQGVSEANDPAHVLGVRTSINLPGRVEADIMFRRISALPNPSVPAYAEMNTRIGWQLTSTFEVALVGQDLLHDQHPEFGTAQPRREEFQRSLRAVFTMRLR